MKNRLKNKPSKEFSELISKIKKREKDLFDPYDNFRINNFGLCADYFTDGKTGASPLSETQEICLEAKTWDKYKRPIIDKRPDIVGLFRFFLLASPYLTGEKDIEAPIRFLLCIVRLDLHYSISGTRDFTDEQLKYRESLFEQKNELPKDNIFRRTIVTAYLDEEVYVRFYEAKDKVEGRYDTEDGLHGGEYTKEAGKEWNGHFNALCDKYSESEYKRIFDDKHYENALSFFEEELKTFTFKEKKRGLDYYPEALILEEVESIGREADDYFKKEGIPDEEA